MLEKIIDGSIKHRWYVLLGVLALGILGLTNIHRLPIDAVPDITNVQVQINTEAPGYSPFEVEQRITLPIETVIGGLPGLQETRSISRYGLSQVTVVFKDKINIYFARQMVNERLQGARGSLPEDVEPKMGPISTGLGEIFMWTVGAAENARQSDGRPYSLMDLRTAQDWIIRPQLRNIPGVTEVNTIGGYEKQYHVTPYPEQLVAHGLTLNDVLEALSNNNTSVGAGYIEHVGEQYLIRVPGQVSDMEEIKEIILGHHEGVPVYVKDVADVIEGKELRSGAATQDGKEVVLGTVFMLKGENSRTVSEAVARKMEAINGTLPEGVVATPVYNRSNLVDATIKTVKENLFCGALLVIFVLFIFLGNFRAAFITALVIPLSMLFTITGMVNAGITANLMSLGALDFGIIIDGAIVIVENCIRQLSQAQKDKGGVLNDAERLAVIARSSKEVQRTILFGQLIIMIVYLPILTLSGIEGKMFVPMALTVLMALIGAMLFSVTFIPAAVAIFLRGKFSEQENKVMHLATQCYMPCVQWSLKNPVKVGVFAAAILVTTFVAALFMGREFIPSLEEGDITVHALRIPGTSLSQAVDMQYVVEKVIKDFPEVKTVFSKIGTDEVASDPMPPHVADTFVIFKPRHEWPNAHKSKSVLVEELQAALQKIPGNAYEFTQPIEMRFNELIAGIRSDVAVKIFGDDMTILSSHGQEVANALRQVKGASDINVEQVTGLPILTININRKEISRLGINVYDVQQAIATAAGGKTAGYVFEGDKRFELAVRLPEPLRQDIEALKRIPIPLPDRNGPAAVHAFRNYIPLGSVAEFKISPGPNQISRENGKRRVVISANVLGRDVGAFVSDAQKVIHDQVQLPAGYWIEWGGQFEQMISAAQTLAIVIPAALLLIFILLFMSLGNAKDAFLVFTGVPLALTGGIMALLLRGIPLSISAGVGFIALSGVAVLNGLVLISFIRKLQNDGIPLDRAIIDGACTRLRPVLMTALVASLGFVPMALAVGQGAEVQRPLATVVIGGIMSSTVLTLIVLPAVYRLLHRKTNLSTLRDG